MPKNIRASVGKSGANASIDVMTVQYLLNCVPAAEGGPVQELAVDGFIGPQTMAAIVRLQQAHLGWSDGRVDPSGPTLPLLQSYDPIPNVPFNPPHHHQYKGMKHGGKQMLPEPPPGKIPLSKGGGKLPGGGKWDAGGKFDPGTKFGGKWIGGKTFR